jgi:alpha-L-rhamnosidase
MRILISEDPAVDRSRYLYEGSPWPAKWVGHPDHVGQESVVIAYRMRFTLDGPQRVRIHVSADERYELFVDGRRAGRGPERGDKQNWFYETHDLDLAAGEHVIVARTWWLGPAAPSAHAQVTVRPGFFLMAEGAHGDLLSTGVSDWQCKVLGGHAFEPPQIIGAFCAVGARVIVDGATFPWGFERGEGDGWGPVKVLAKAALASYLSEHPPEWVLRPALLPAMLEEPIRVGTVRHVSDKSSDRVHPVQVRNETHLADDGAAWQRMIRGEGTVTIGANATRRVILDLDNYYCAFPEVVTTGGRGSRVRVYWAESLYQQPEGHSKGNRDEVDGKFLLGMGDTFLPDGGRSRPFNTLWWEAGRYVEITVHTADEPLTIESFNLRETRYPLAFESRFEASDARLAEVTPIALRTLEVCAHETYFDCPYYEQLMYSGDTRLHTLVTYATSRDDRLPRKAVEMFDVSRLNSGLTEARYPSRVRQVIPTFSLWWVGMVHDYALWRDDPAFVAARMPGVRAVLEPFRAMITDEGLLRSPDGWSFVDWVPGWRDGMPKDAYRGINGTINALFVYAMRLAADLEEWSGEPELAARNRKTADRVAKAAGAAFFDEGRGLVAEDRARTQFSEHAQCLALLGGMLDEPKRLRVAASLFADKDLAQGTIFFTHYLFEACRVTGRMDVLNERLGMWFDLKRYGFKTTFEMPEPTRSDCHAWGAHPVYHYFATLLGIRPTSPGFKTARIEPHLGPLASAKGTMVHPRGEIVVDVAVDGGRLKGTISLPDGVTGVLVANGREVALRSGGQQF